MRIRSLTFKNLNSLHGTWSIDFTVPEYRDGGIFAITGPTGSGKSTVLDAICLALYGCTPRLGRVTQSGNEIMSRHRGECFAEVVFETAEGSFTVHWSQRRARGKTDGTLQSPRHEIAYTNGAVLESSLRLTGEKVVSLTGMDFDRFTRTMLLAQGGFARFLDADADERSPILEQITGTEIYSTISIKVHERFRLEREKLGALRTELEGITVLTDEEVGELEREIGAKESGTVQLEKEREILRAGLEWYRALDLLEEQCVAAARKREAAQAAREVFIPENTRLQAALRAAELEGEYSLLELKRRELETGIRHLHELEESLQCITAEIHRITGLHDAAEENLTECRKLQAAHIPLLKQVRELDSEYARLEKDRNATAAVAEQETGEFKLAEDELRRCLAEKEMLDESLRKGIEWRKEHASDGELTECSAVLAERLGQLGASGKKCAVLEKEIDSIARELKLAGDRLEMCVKGRGDAERRKKDAEAQLERKLAEVKTLLDGATLAVLRRERDALIKEKYYVGKIISLEEEREHLVDGRPCPLCGATEHPYAAGVDVPNLSEIGKRLTVLEQTIGHVETLESAIADEERAILKLGEACAEKSRLQMKAESEVAVQEHSLDTKRKETFLNAEETEALRQILSLQLAPFGMAVPEPGRENELSDEISDCSKRWKKALEKLDKLEKDAPSAEKAYALAAQKRDVLTELCRKQQEHLQKIDTAIAECREKRRALFGDRDPDTVESEDAAALERAANDLKQLDRQFTAQERESAAVSAKIGDLKVRIAGIKEEVGLKEGVFIAGCHAAGFESVDQYTGAVIDASERNRLREMKERIDSDCTSTEALAHHQEALLQSERKKMVTKTPPDTLTEQFGMCDGQVRQLRESLGALRQRLSADSAARSRVSGRRELLDAQQRECGRWERLHALIGSADGRKFRNFAQGITFEYLIAHANRQLSLLSDRYLLTSSPDAPLDLYVIDNYQAAEIRTARNLSGGESFIISLALALGLSSMTGRTIRVDSLFLDEGFGTLDEEALETALETLSTLHQEGKCIGVISHVQALKERIPTQITVTPVSGGESVLSGPGCRRID